MDERVVLLSLITFAYAQLSAVRDGRPLSTIPARRGSRAKSLSTKLLCQESALTNTTDAEIPSMFVPLEENVGLGEFLRRRRNLRGQVELRLGQPQAHRVAAISAGNGRSSEEIEPDDELRSEEIETDVRSKVLCYLCASHANMTTLQAGETSDGVCLRPKQRSKVNHLSWCVGSFVQDLTP